MKTLCAQHLCKSYGGTQALRDVTLTLEPEHIYGLLGRNGAGKTTLLKAFTAQIPLTSGTLTYGGEPVWENEKALSELCLGRELSSRLGNSENALRVKDYLRAGRLFYAHWDEAYARQLVQRFGLEPRKRLSQLSKGMVSMLSITMAFASRAPLTLLDEPVAGLDMVAREEFYKLLLEEFTATGRTFVVSTHILEEAAPVFDRVLVLKEGQLIEDCETDALLAQFCAVSGREDVVDAACAGHTPLRVETMGRQKCCTLRTPAADIAARGLDVDVTPLALHQVFVALCGGEVEP